MSFEPSMVPRWKSRFASYTEEEDWDICALRIVNKQLEEYIKRMPGGGTGDLTLAELQEMASRQQQQMEAQQQMLVAKEQRLKYLRQQEARHAQLASEGERVRKMRERVESQELKLRKLRALRGQAEQYRTTNGSLTGELDAVRAVFNEKEKELAIAVARVDRLNRQLQELRNNSSSSNNTSGGAVDNKQAAVAAELEKLRKELLIRNKLNEQQGNTISAKEKMLNQRREEVARMDARIRELQQRLRKRQAQEAQMKQQQQQSQNSGNNRSNLVNTGKSNGGLGTNHNQSSSGRSVATVEPYIQYAPQNTVKDDTYSKTSGGIFQKQDPKYQTLPARVKFSPPNGGEGSKLGGKLAEMNNNSELIEEYQLPTVLPSGASTTKSSHHQWHGESRSGTRQPPPNTLDKQPSQGKPEHFPPHPATQQAVPSASKGHIPDKNSASVFPPVLKNSQLSGGGDGISQLHKSGGTLHPVISIHEEERQAGSGQSSPASSEASTASSGGLQVKGGADGEINTSPIGPVSAMIERLNRSEHGPTRSAFTHRNTGPPSQPASASEKNQNQQPPSSSSTFHSAAASRYGDSATSNQQPQQPQTATSATANSGPAGSAHGPPHLNQKPAPTYRYASKNQIANTYMGRLGGAAVERYQRNLNQIYKNLDSSAAEASTSFSHGSDALASKEASEEVKQPPPPQQQQQEQPQQQQLHPQFGVVSSPGYPDIASDKGSFKLNTPKHVRRRHSDSENEDLNKAMQEVEQQQQQKTSASSSSAAEKTVPGKDSTDSSTPAQMKANPSLPPSSKSSLEVSKEKEPKAKPSPDITIESKDVNSSSQPREDVAKPVMRRTKSNLKKEGVRRSTNRVSFDPLALLLDASLEGELDLVRKVAVQVDDVSTPNDEGITALHNAICAGHYEIVKVLVEFGCDVNSPDSDGWTPLHCAASCNNLAMVKFLVEHGACVFASTISDQETAADKCEEEEDGYEGCSDYLYSIQEKLGITNSGEVYGVFDYQATKVDELSFQIGDKLTVLRKGDEQEKEWWWARLNGKEGYIPRNMLGLHPRVIPGPKEVSVC